MLVPKNFSGEKNRLWKKKRNCFVVFPSPKRKKKKKNPLKEANWIGWVGVVRDFFLVDFQEL